MPLSWGAKKQISIFGVLAVAALLISGYFIYLFVKQTFSGESQTPTQAQNISIIWSRVFPSRSGFADAAALLENPNKNFGAEKFIYAFRVYDKDNVLVAIKENQTFVNPGERLIVFEPNIPIQNRVPQKAILEVRSLNFEPKPSAPILQIDAIRKDLFPENDPPRAEIALKNQANQTYKKIQATLVLFSDSGEALAASETLVDELAIGEEKTIVFTWPEKILGVANSQIFLRALP